MKEVVPLATQMLAERGKFAPYGGVVKEDGTTEHVPAPESGVGHAEPGLQIAVLTDRFQKDAEAGKIKATAIVSDVQVQPPGATGQVNAIQVQLEHRNNYSVEVIYPYVIRGKKLLHATSFARQGRRVIFK